MDLNRLIIDTALAGLRLQKRDGSFPAGQNGPYNDNDTPVRNTSHWTITLLNAYKRSGDERLLHAGCRALQYLCSDEARPFGYTFKHRNREYSHQDRANGLVGQAWTIEALAMGGKFFDESEVLDTALEVFCSHPFDPELGLWKYVDIDGTVQGYHMTFNQHLWFAAAGSLLASTAESRRESESETVRSRVRTFMHNIHRNIHIFPSGCIIHPMLPKWHSPAAFHPEYQRAAMNKWSRILLFKTINVLREMSQSRLLEKSRPYHPFNLYAMAILYEEESEFAFWESRTFEKILAYSKRPGLINSIRDNRYGFDYNPGGFELGIAWEIIDGEKSSRSDEIIADQIRHSYDHDTSLMSRSKCDPETHMARFYELTRYPYNQLDA